MVDVVSPAVVEFVVGVVDVIVVEVGAAAVVVMGSP